MLRYLSSITLVTALAVSGCATLPDTTVRFQGLSDCPAATPATLLADQQALGPASSTHALQCALTVAREASDPALRRSALPSRLALHLAERHAAHSPDREILAREGVRLAEQALAQGGAGDGAVHYYLAANLGLAVRDHPLEAADSLTRLEQALQKAEQLSPAVDQGGPLRLSGMLYLKAPAWPSGIGDGDKALDYLKQAVERYPEHPLNHLFYAQALWEVDAQGTAAQAELAKGLTALNTGSWGYNQAIWRQEFSTVARQIGLPAR